MKALHLMMAATVGGMVATTASAADWWGDAPSNRLTIGAKSSRGRDVVRVNLDQALTGPTGEQTVTLRKGNRILGEVTFRLGAGPEHAMNLDFTATAGDRDTEFFIGVPNETFAAVSNAEARAQAQLIVTDVDGNGATATGMFGNADVYSWNYNGTVPNGVLFDTQVTGPIIVTPGATIGIDEQSPFDGVFVSVPEPVSALSGRAHFTLTAFDQAEGNGRFELRTIPAPGSFAMAAGAFALLLKRRRH